VSTVALEGRSRDISTLALREQLTNLRALLVLSILMTESADEEQILNLAASSAPSLGPWQVSGFAFTESDGADDERWRPGAAFDRREPLPAEVADGLAGLSPSGGELRLPGHGWARAYPLRSVAGLLGYLVATADAAPTSDAQFLIQVVAQQTGVAVSNARMHQRERAGALELEVANHTLEVTVATLRRGMQIHERLTAVAAAGEGSAGIAEALHDLTGLPVAIEDRYGNLRAWAGPDRPDPYPKSRQEQRDKLFRELLREGKSVRDGARVVALASPRPDVLGFIALIDPGRTIDASDLVALEHCATVLAVELARVRGLADAELRLRRDLLHDLLSGIDDENALVRAEALGYDLGQPHRVVLAEWSTKTQTDDAALHAVRRALRELRLTALLGTQSGVIVMLVGGRGGAPVDWEALRTASLRELGGGRCRLAVGGLYQHPSELPRSLREAQLSLRLQKVSGQSEQTTVYGELGVFQMFASMPDLRDIENFARRWLHALIDYDEAKGTDLVKTLGRYLDNGGRYEATALALSIHRSTLKYRLHRIRELTDLDVGDPETHFNLQLATRAWTTLQALRD
jgi:sugar diacid utilization regulator